MTGQLVWFITGCSSGLGRLLTLEALARGDKVIATARPRSLAKLDDLAQRGADVLALEVTAPLEELKAVAAKAAAIHGRIDVLVNNAGYFAVGGLEEATPEETYNQFNTNIFAGLNVARAFLPYMRPRKSGTVVWLGSIGGWIPLINAGLYAATKAATRSLSQTLDAELAPLGLRSLNFEFGYFRTEFLTASQRAPYIPRIADYAEVCGAAEAAFQAANGKQPGDPVKGVSIMVDSIRGEGVALGREVPGTVQLGRDTVENVDKVSKETQGIIGEWKDVWASTDFPEGV
ncbi:NAD(P)-binding protein [Dentipellis sp. KUC8613]|nr:NAD(P)-binding protein [Dentipellis sp. KUC8613]